MAKIINLQKCMKMSCCSSHISGEWKYKKIMNLAEYQKISEGFSESSNLFKWRWVTFTNRLRYSRNGFDCITDLLHDKITIMLCWCNFRMAHICLRMNRKFFSLICNLIFGLHWSYWQILRDALGIKVSHLATGTAVLHFWITHTFIIFSFGS